MVPHPQVLVGCGQSAGVDFLALLIARLALPKLGAQDSVVCIYDGTAAVLVQCPRVEGKSVRTVLTSWRVIDGVQQHLQSLVRVADGGIRPPDRWPAGATCNRCLDGERRSQKPAL